MPEQFENPEATKLEDETVSDATAEKRMNSWPKSCGEVHEN